MTAAHTAAGTGRPSGGVVTGVMVAIATVSTATMAHGVTRLTATAMAITARADALTAFRGAALK